MDNLVKVIIESSPGEPVDGMKYHMLYTADGKLIPNVISTEVHDEVGKPCYVIAKILCKLDNQNPKP